MSMSMEGVRRLIAAKDVIAGEPSTVTHKIKVERLAGDEVFVLMRGPSSAFTREDVINLALDPALTLYV